MAWIEGAPINGVVVWLPLDKVARIEATPSRRLDDPAGDYVVVARMDSDDDVWLGRFPGLDEAARYVRPRIPLSWPTAQPA